MSTLQDIADYVGISVSTASMAIRDHAAISIATKKKVWAAQEKFGYRLNLRPRPISHEKASGQVRTIAFVLVDRSFSNELYAQSFEGVAKSVACREWRPTYISTTLADLHHNRFPVTLNTEEIDGIIVAGMYDEKAHTNLSKLGIPIVVLGNHKLGDRPWAACEVDLAQGMHLMIKRLYAYGHRRYALQLRGRDTAFERSIEDAYLREITDFGCTNIHICCDGEGLTFMEDLRAHLLSPNRAGALILTSDVFVREIYDFCFDNRIDIPRDLSVAAFGRRDRSERPTLAKVHSIGQDFGATAMDKLARAIENPEGTLTRELFPMQYFSGGSVGTPPQPTA